MARTWSSATTANGTANQSMRLATGASQTVM